jgi:hypothetical protein
VIDLQLGDHVGGATKLVEIRTRRNELHFVGTDLVPLELEGSIVEGHSDRRGARNGPYSPCLSA